MDTPTQDIPDVEPIYSIEDIIKQVEGSGINLGDDPIGRVNTFIEHGLLPQPRAGKFSSWAVQRIIAIQNKLYEGNSLQDLKNEVSKERRRFLNQVTDLNSMVHLYKKFSSNSMFFLASLLLLAVVSFGFLAAGLTGTTNPVVVASENIIKAATNAGKAVAKTAAKPLGQTLVTIIKTSKDENSTSADPLQLTNLEIDTPVIPGNLVQLDSLGNLNIGGDIVAASFTGSGANLTDLGWGFLINRPGVLSAVDSVSNDGGNIDLIAGSGVTITPNDDANTIILSAIDIGSVQEMFKNIAVGGQSTIVSDINNDTLTLAAGANVSLTTDPNTDTLTIGVTGTIANADTLDSLDSTAFLRTIGGTMAGDINFNTNLALNIGNAGTDFTASGGLNVAGDLDVAGHAAFGASASVSSGAVLGITESLAVATPYGINIDVTKSGGAADNIYGIYSTVTTNVTGGGGAYGGYFDVLYNLPAGSVSHIKGASFNIGSLGGSSGAITFEAIGVEVRAAWLGTAVPNTVKGVYIGDMTYPGTTNAYGIQISDQSNCTTFCFPIYQTGGTGLNYFIAETFFGDTVAFGRWPTGNDTSYAAVIQGSLCVDDGTANCPAGPTSGAIYVENSVGAGNVSAFDLAEYYPASAPVERGDVVRINTQGTTVSKSSGEYDSKVLGIVSTDPAAVIDETNITFGKTAGDKFNPMKPYVALAGRVPVKVSNENGNIKPGDPLTSSSTPGVAMKATKSGPTIGKALESYSGAEVGKVMVFVSTSWYVSPTSSEQSTVSSLSSIDTESLSTGSVETQILYIGERKLSMANNGSLKIDGDVEVAGDLIANKLIVKEVQTEKINISDQGSDPSIGSSELKAGNLEVFVKTNSVTANSKVFITATSSTGGQSLQVSNKKQGERFTVRVDNAVNMNIKFDWLVIN